MTDLDPRVVQEIAKGPNADERFHDEWKRRELFATRIALLAAECERERCASAEAVTVADILAGADHIEKNGIALAKFGGSSVDEGRCRELCAMYLREFVHTLRLEQKLIKIEAAIRGAKP